MISQVQARSPEDPAFLRARQLVLAHGRQATAYQLINPGLSLWFSPDQEAVAGFVDSANYRVIAGAPVCGENQLPKVIHELESSAYRDGRRICYFGAESWIVDRLLREQRHSVVLLGAQPAWHPRSWSGILEHRASLRAQLHRARNKEVRVREWPISHVALLPELHRCLEEWLTTRGLPPMHFLVEPETLGCLYDRRLFVAHRGEELIGFLVASPVPQRRGWLIEQIIRGRGAVNGTSELLIDAAIRTMAAEGFEYVTLGLAALSRRARVDYGVDPLWLRFVFGWVRLHGRRFYNFEGLDAFKAKFQPEQWESIYAVTNEPRFSVSALYAIAGAFSERAPIRMVLRALGRAAAQEGRWLWKRLVT